MISRSQAESAVLLEYGREFDVPGDRLVVTEVIDKPYGWVIFFGSQKFMETNDFRWALGGNAPVIVLHNGAMHPLGTAKAAEEYIAEFEAAHGLAD